MHPETAVPETGPGTSLIVAHIPAADRQPLRLLVLPQPPLTAYQQIVDGHVRRIDLTEPGLTLVLNPDGHQLDMPLNRRATALAWVQHPGMRRIRYPLHGDVLIAGPPTPGQTDSPLPDDVRELFLTPNPVQIQAPDRHHPDRWRVTTHRAHWYEAYRWVLPRLTQPYTPQDPQPPQRRIVPGPSSQLTDLVVRAAHEHGFHGSGDRDPRPGAILGCRTVADLAHQVQAARLRAGEAFHLHDLALLNLRDDGQDWLALHRGLAFRIPPVPGLIHDGHLPHLLAEIAAIAAHRTPPPGA
ncbi:DUF3846 domain-containing protein [Kineosporia sp. J2-2]|uniref:DUF3846 domain-containing protein n=1 Tax=Kineosporia corallincola TaxID=2835133 RepID=A0ABS5TPD2_9ACTN|nr:DUF3846 domain-containing protein [Kineosporia corallincola]MBT0772965.1 DUF3846 domain-containing protein [Kineosporia corallincola]